MKKLSQYNVKFEEYEEYEEDTSDRQSLNSVVKNYLQNTQFVNLVVPKKWLVYPPMVLFEVTVSTPTNGKMLSTLD